MSNLFTNDELGLDVDGFDMATGFNPHTGLNRAGVDIDGRNEEGFKADAHCIMRDREERDAQGYLPDGYHYKTGFNRAGVDRENYNRAGFRLAADGVMRDRDGLDVDGRDTDGFDSLGRDINGLDRDGLDLFGEPA